MISNIYSNNGYDFFEQKFKNRQDLISYLKSAKPSLVFSSKPLASNDTSNGSFWFSKLLIIFI